MILSKTPLRVSLWGGGTDYPIYFKEHGGEVLGFAIDKYVYLSLRKLPPFFPHRHRLVYSQVETVRSIDDIVHPSIRAVLSFLKPDCGIELHYDADLPARSGMGSSSSFTVGLLNTLHAYRGHMASKLDLAREAIHIEQNELRENVGCQDQIWAAYGGFNHITFHTDGSFSVRPVIVSEYRKLELVKSLMLFFTGFSRFASEIAGKQIANVKQKQKSLHAMKDMVGEAMSLLDSNRPITDIGRLLHESWKLKRGLSDAIATKEVDDIYESARAAGAVGGKLLGAGGGGFVLLMVPIDRQAEVRERLKSLIEVPFNINYTGSIVPIYEPNGI